MHNEVVGVNNAWCHGCGYEPPEILGGNANVLQGENTCREQVAKMCAFFTDHSRLFERVMGMASTSNGSARDTNERERKRMTFRAGSLAPEQLPTAALETWRE